MAVLSSNTRQAQLTSKVSEAVEAGEKFIDIFYETVDKRRQVRMCKTLMLFIWKHGEGCVCMLLLNIFIFNH